MKSNSANTLTNTHNQTIILPHTHTAKHLLYAECPSVFVTLSLFDYIPTVTLPQIHTTKQNKKQGDSTT